MRRSGFSGAVVLGLVLLGASLARGQVVGQAVGQVVVPIPTPPAATGPSTAASTHAVDNQSLYDQLLKTRLAEIMQGRRTLTWEDIRRPEFWYDNIRDLIVTLVVFIPRLIGTMAFLLVFWLIYRGMRRLAMGTMKKREIDSSIRDLLGAMIKWTVMGFGIVIACNQLGIPIVAMLTGVSIIGLAVGFAAQETLANFIAGIVIFLDKPFTAGDWINIDQTYGQIKRVSFRSTRMLTLDGEMVIFPNVQMLNSKVINHSAHPVTRLNIPIGIAYKESIDKARAALLKATQSDSRVSSHPAPEVVVVECAASSVNLLLRFWITDESLEKLMWNEYLEKAKKALDQANIAIPFPHVQLMLEQTPALAGLKGS